MTSLRVIGIACGSIAVLATLASRRAHACSSLPVSGFDGLVTLPAMDSTAPRNTLIWVPQPERTSYSEPSYTPDDVVVKLGDATIVTTVFSIDTPYRYDRSLWVLVPDAPLPAGSVAVTLKTGGLLTRFTVENIDDLAAPAAPELTEVEVEGAYFGGFSCPEESMVTVSTTATDGIVMLLDRVAGAMLPTSVLAAGIHGRARAYDLGEGEQKLTVVAVDLAGNLSSTTRLPTLTVPTETSGCAAGGSSRAIGPVMLALVALGARRRRR